MHALNTGSVYLIELSTITTTRHSTHVDKMEASEVHTANLHNWFHRVKFDR